jgi:hypothetical protein
MCVFPAHAVEGCISYYNLEVVKKQKRIRKKQRKLRFKAFER